MFSEAIALLFREAGYVAGATCLATKIGLPEVVKRREVHARRDRTLHHILQARCFPSSLQFAWPAHRPCKLLSACASSALRICHRCNVKEHALRHKATAAVPNCCGDRCARTSDPSQFADGDLRLRNEVQHQK